MTYEKRKKTEPVVSWILAMLLCPLGVCLAAKSGFGVSMIEAPVYAMYQKLSQIWSWYTFGTSEYVVQAILLIVMCIFIRRFKFRYLLSFVTAFIFGWILDGWNFLLSGIVGDTILSRIILGVLGCIITSFAVSMFFRTWLPLEVWELFVKEVSERFGWKLTKVKWIYDLSSLALGIILMLALLGSFRWDVVGIGTIVTTFVNAPIIGFFSKLLDRFWNSLAIEE